MSLSRKIIEQAWQRSAGLCECRHPHHKHPGERCGQRLNWINRGIYGEGAWEAQRLTAADGSLKPGVEILCWDCHAKDI